MLTSALQFNVLGAFIPAIVFITAKGHHAFGLPEHQCRFQGFADLELHALDGQSAVPTYASVALARA